MMNAAFDKTVNRRPADPLASACVILISCHFIFRMGIRRTAVTLFDGGFGFHLSMTEMSELRRVLFPARYRTVAVVGFLRVCFIHRCGSAR